MTAFFIPISAAEYLALMLPWTILAIQHDDQPGPAKNLAAPWHSQSLIQDDMADRQGSQ